MNESKALEKSPIQRMLEGKAPNLASAIPATMRRYLTPERLTKVVLMDIHRNPDLGKCTPKSIYTSLISLASIGLEPGGPLGQAYLVPYNNKDRRTGSVKKEATAIIGYRGYISLARRSGDMASIVAQVVYERDEFDLDFAAENPIRHKPHMGGDRGKSIGAYCLARFKDGSVHPEFMTMADIEKIRKRSRAANKGPWVTDYDEMAKKTVVRRAAKYWPLTVEMASALDLDNQADKGDEQLVLDAVIEEEPENQGDRILGEIEESKESEESEEERHSL